MSKTNYELLEDNRAMVIAFAEEVQSDVFPAKKPQEVLNKEVQDLVAKGDLSAAIRQLDEIKDNKIGIVWHDREDPNDVLVRDARGSQHYFEQNGIDPTSALKTDAGEKYGMQVLNEVRAGIQLLDKAGLEPEKLEAAKQKLMHIATDAMTDASELNSSNIKTFNTEILHVLDEADIAYTATVGGKKTTISAAEQLNFATETASLHDEHRHIVTLTTAEGSDGQKHTVMEADIMLNGLTKDQKEQYIDIAKSTPGADSGVEWFDKMPRHKQDLLRDAARGIADGTKVIPTQLLGDVVGIRNGYQKVTAIKSPEKETQILSKTLHCGAPATKIKVVGKAAAKGATAREIKRLQAERLAARQEIVDENIKQLQSFVPPGERLNLNILNSKTPLNVRNENFILDQVTKGGKKEGATVSVSPINRWRLLGGGRDTKQFKDNLSKIGGDLKADKELKNVAKHLEKGTSVFAKFAERITFGAYKSTETKAKDELDTLKATKPELARDLGVALEARTLADSSTLFASSQNVNLELTSKMDIVGNSVKSGALTDALKVETVKEYPRDVVFCKSGKDRTGYVLMKNTQRTVASHLGIDPQSELGQRNFSSQVAGGHTQEMAGIQGGTTGCHTVKTNPEFGLNSEDRAAAGIVNQKSSHFNSKIKGVKDKGKAAEIIKDFDKSCLESPTYAMPKQIGEITVFSRPRSNAITADTRTQEPVGQATQNPKSHAVTSPSTASAAATTAAKKMRGKLPTTAEASSPLPPPGKHQKEEGQGRGR